MTEQMHTPKMQAFGVAVAITAVLGGGVYLFFNGHKAPGTNPQPVVTEKEELEGSVGDTSLNRVQKKKAIAKDCTPGTEMKDASTEEADIELVYPRICDGVFDGTVEHIALTLAADLSAQAKKDVPEMRKMITDRPVMYTLNLEPFDIFFNDGIASVLLSAYIDTGGAHGNIAFYSVNVDRKKQKRLQIEDLFDQSSGYLGALGKMTKAELGTAVTFPEGLDPKQENFSNFTLTDKEITIHFPPYQVAAYAAGPQKATFSFSELGAYWKGGR